MKQLVIGSAGQIGSALVKILDCDGYDIASEKNPGGYYDVLHITIPYSDKFAAIVKNYAALFKADLIIIHSTVPVGTTSQIYGAVYSPCRGVHPELEKGIRTMTKYFAGEKAQEAAKIFADKYMDCVYSNTDRAIESLEAAKLWDTTQYGWNIVLEKVIHEYCEKNNLDFNVVYTLFNQSYNDGYEKLGMSQYKKYILEHREGKIGGHCIIPNLELLNEPICEIIKKLNIA